jgi:WhiB family redox-sensing transcriptional regulator
MRRTLRPMMGGHGSIDSGSAGRLLSGGILGEDVPFMRRCRAWGVSDVTQIAPEFPEKFGECRGFARIGLDETELHPCNTRQTANVAGVEEVLHVMDMVLLPLSDVEELAWQERALCAQTDPEAFFPEKGGSTREAKKICLSCEVRTECLEYALSSDERFGIWGGLSERERRRLKKRAV